MQHNKLDLGRLILPLLAFKTVYWVLLLAAVYLWQEPGYGEIGRLHQKWPLNGGPSFSSHFCTWDAGHYLYLSAAGYKAGDESCAFYPLFPVLIRWFADIFSGNHLFFGLVLSNLFSLAGWGVFTYMLQQRFDWAVSRLALILLLIFPGSVFFQFVFSETLFFLLIMLLWLGLEKRWYRLACLAALLMPLTRAIGVFCVLPIFWHFLAVNPPQLIRIFYRDHPRLSRVPVLMLLNSEKTVTIESGAVKGLVAVTLILAPLLAWAMYFCLMAWWTGNLFEGFEAQKKWHVHSMLNLINVPKFLFELCSPTNWHGFQGSGLDRALFILLFYSMPWLWYRDKNLFVWAIVLGIIPAMSGSFTSYTRFVSVCFPLFITLAVFLNTPRHRWLRLLTFIVFGAFHLFFLWRYTTCRWVG